ncbi:MAG: hypothetical protein JJU48_01910 [Methylophaga sp.]|nr:hypothetical protein [Methylophaga sp.]
MVKILDLLVSLKVSSAMANEVQYQLEGNTYQGYFVTPDQATNWCCTARHGTARHGRSDD